MDEAVALSRATRSTNRRLVWAVGIFLGLLTVLVALGVAAGLSLVADARDAAASGRALVARQRADDAAKDVTQAEAEAARQRRVDEAIERVSSALARGLALHDANIHQDLEELRRRLGAGSAPLPVPTPITSAAPAAPAPSPVTTTTAAPPAPVATTTTTCPRLPNGRCRP